MSRLNSIVIHCRDAYAAGPFWSLALGLPPVPEDAAALRNRTLAEDESVLLRDPDGRQPDVWISPTSDPDRGRGLVHLDIRLDDLAELQALIDAGAQVAWEVYEPHRWTVLAAPDGVLFCAIHPG
ncbi:VOC family protein [Hamadaea sp. NPDC051192]|uniref:VOC family protein n=1 Tax=Hamadaea sp. NPDC051192 TaxID=3154940 RepID=UPI0034378589